MATTYELPSTMHKHVHHQSSGRQRGLSHSRKSGPSLTPSQFAAINNGNVMANGGFAIPTPINESPPVRENHHYSTSSTDTVRAASTDPSKLQLPKPASFSTPTMERSKSWERRKSVGLPTHLRLQNDGYGFPVTADQSLTHDAKRLRISKIEFLSAMLVPLPFVFATLAFGFGLFPQALEQDSTLDGLDGTFQDKAPRPQDQIGEHTPSFNVACGLTSGTLLLIGLLAKYTKALGSPLDRRKSNADMVGKHDNASSGTLIARKIILRILTVGLPIYATSELGIRVAIIMMLAVTSNIMRQEVAADFTDGNAWTQQLRQKKYAVTAMLLQLLCDLSGFTNSRSFTSICLAYLALGIAVFILPPPYPSHHPRSSVVSSTAPASAKTTSTVLSTPWESAPSGEVASSAKFSGISPLICTVDDVNLTIYSGAILGGITTILFFALRSGPSPSSMLSLVGVLLAPCAGAAALTAANTKILRTTNGPGFLIGSVAPCFFLAITNHEWRVFLYQSILISVSFLATKLDTHTLHSSHSHHKHHHHHQEGSAIIEHKNMSRLSAFLIIRVQGWRLLEQILAEKDSRRIFYFMCLNFGFMLVQTFYGIATGSLGLLSDSIHMFFDCLALVVGLCAAVMSKWPPSVRFPYGYGKMDTLAGFANGIFLMLISIEIVYEALERLAEGVRIQRLGELLTVSFAGLVVNLVGMMAFGHAHHGHGHSHGNSHDHSHGDDHHHSGHSHDDQKHDHNHEHSNNHTTHGHCSHDEPHQGHSHHDHSHHDHSHHEQPSSAPSYLTPSQNFDIAPLSAVSHHSHLQEHLSPNLTPSPSAFSSVPGTPSKPVALDSHTHSHGHGHEDGDGHSHHNHHHGNENMHGIFLHVLADTLGSVAVVISTLLIHFYGWSGFDPIASCLIAILIFASAVPLVQSSASKLLMSVPEDTEYELRETLAGVAGLRGVVGYAVPKFWIDEGSDRNILGAIHVIAGKTGDLDDVKERCIAYLKGRGMDVLVQVEREGSSRCWCQATRPAQGF